MKLLLFAVAAALATSFQSVTTLAQVITNSRPVAILNSVFTTANGGFWGHNLKVVESARSTTGRQADRIKTERL